MDALLTHASPFAITVVCSILAMLLLRRLGVADRPIDSLAPEDLLYLPVILLAPAVLGELLQLRREEVQRFSVLLTGLGHLPVLALTFFLIRRGRTPKPTFGLHPVGPIPSIAISMLLALLALYPALYLAGLSSVVLESLQFTVQPQAAVKAINQEEVLLLKFLAMGVACTLIPVAEEFLFRGLLYTVLRRLIGSPGGVLLSALLFSAMHTNAYGAVPLFLVGVLLALLYERTRSLYCPIAFHALYNASMLFWQWLNTRPGS